MDGGTKKRVKTEAGWMAPHAPDAVQLNEEQARIFKRVVDRPRDQQLLLTVIGPGGCGKSTLLRALRRRLDQVSVCAFTGVAALLVDGSTVHKRFGLTRSGEPRTTIQWGDREVLFIDELSLLSVRLLDSIDAQLKMVKKQFNVPFGGVSIIMFGDLLQLPPVGASALFTSPLWELFSCTLLDRSMRHKNDAVYGDLLARFRLAQLTREDYALLDSRRIVRDPLDNTDGLRVFYDNRSVNVVNAKLMRTLKQETFTITAQDTDSPRPPESELRRTAFKSQLPDSITICEGARVMLLVNMTHSLVNGRMGVVKSISISPPSVCVEFFPIGCRGAETVKLEPTADYFLHGRRYVKRKQLAIRAAFATTIHKVQGQTVDSILIGLAQCDHLLAYTAFSRVRALENVQFYGGQLEPLVAGGAKHVKLVLETIKKMPQF